MTRHNVVFFGETGVGKSSLINMLAGSNVAQTSSKATGCTLESRGYPVKISKSLFYLVDTAGLEEGDQGRVPKSDAIVQLYTLLKQMEDGVSLLVFVMRPKITDGVVNNWRLFQEVICKYQVPAVVIITGLENEEDMDDWWVMNKETFREYGIRPDGNACVTATRGNMMKDGMFAFQKEYNESKLKIEKLLRSLYLAKPWKMDVPRWFNEIFTNKVVYRFLGWQFWSSTKKVEIEGAVNQLVKRCGMTKKDADALAKLLKAVDHDA